MPGEETRLSRRRVLGGLLTVGAASAAAGAGTMAAFSDSESSSGNAVSAGTLDLKLDGSDQTVTFLNEQGVAPGDSGQSVLPIENAGTVAGTLEIEVSNVESSENGYSGAENGQDNSPNDGELDEYLELRADLDGSRIIDWTYANQIPVGQTYQLTTLSGGASADLTVEWRLQSADNVAQSDGFSFDLTFRLIQEGYA